MPRLGCPGAVFAKLGCPRVPTIQSVPYALSSLLQRTRHGILVLLLVVLPLQSVVQLVAGVQGHRHLHTGALSGLVQPLRALLDQLHAAQDPRLQASWAASRGPAAGLHEHGGIFHTHAHDTHDAVDVGDAADDAAQGGVTAFLAWLPIEMVWTAAQGSAPPVAGAWAWRDRVVAPPLAPPRA